MIIHNTKLYKARRDDDCGGGGSSNWATKDKDFDKKGDGKIDDYSKSKDELTELANNIMLFVDRNGEVIWKRSDPFACGVHMQYKSGKLKMFMAAQQSPYSNGYAGVSVVNNGKVVFQAAGNMIGRAYMKTTTYKPGKWEEKVII